ncbi:MAG: hypothetical protein KKI12_14485 [Proteobacteria bacterium]|nr:hypothetical protein [Pseudomonadota bacterium]MBU4260090.1 hypothetical protein [Pseudomonadota bacterium]MBU4289364.1 hypothetical protein [Pseudomonadota bacterium]MBU4414685.1 hypothetical protein [Pseudomonadota bacterium]MCG2757654.1 hypothetical protein [Desulfobacteraceae bacterium]
MPLDQNPLFRKVIAPWYDTEKACFTVIVFMLVVFLFGIAGILEAVEKIEYNEHIWVPALLVAMSGGVIASTSIRLIKRYAHRLSKQGPKVP